MPIPVTSKDATPFDEQFWSPIAFQSQQRIKRCGLSDQSGSREGQHWAGELHHCRILFPLWWLIAQRLWRLQEIVHGAGCQARGCRKGCLIPSTDATDHLCKQHCWRRPRVIFFCIHFRHSHFYEAHLWVSASSDCTCPSVDCQLACRCTPWRVFLLLTHPLAGWRNVVIRWHRIAIRSDMWWHCMRKFQNGASPHW